MQTLWNVFLIQSKVQVFNINFTKEMHYRNQTKNSKMQNLIYFLVIPDIKRTNTINDVDISTC